MFYKFVYLVRGVVTSTARMLTSILPVIEHKRRSVGVSPEYWFIIPLPAATGTGIVRVIGLWNFRLAISRYRL